MNLNSGALTLGANAGLDIFAFSQVAFRVITKRNITVKTCTCEGAVAGESPYVMIYGVCPGREMPILEIPWCPGWLPTGKSAVGTIGFSRRIALEHCILRHLKEVNAHTTILPSEADVVDGVWHIKLTTWAEHALRKGSRIGCQWQEVSSGSDNYLAFEWKYRDEWKHEHEGNSADDANHEYRLSCEYHRPLFLAVSLIVSAGVTHNTVRVPTHFDDRTRTLDIIVSGTSVVSVSGKDSQYKWGYANPSLYITVSYRHLPQKRVQVDLVRIRQGADAKRQAQGLRQLQTRPHRARGQPALRRNVPLRCRRHARAPDSEEARRSGGHSR